MWLSPVAFPSEAFLGIFYQVIVEPSKGPTEMSGSLECWTDLLYALSHHISLSRGSSPGILQSSVTLQAESLDTETTTCFCHDELSGHLWVHMAQNLDLHQAIP